MTALVVDDHPAMRVGVKHLIERYGMYEVIRDFDSRDMPWQLIRDRKPDLVVMDLDASNMLGLETIEKLRRTSPKSAVLVVSDHREAMYSTWVHRAGANGFITKQSNLEELTLAIATVTAGFSYFPHTAQEDVASRLPMMLSNREVTMVRLLATGRSHKTIASQLCVSVKTVSAYKIRILRRLGLKSIIELVEFAREHGILTSPEQIPTDAAAEVAQ
jgi:DNA-binding NarL/FixJ family response regulator